MENEKNVCFKGHISYPKQYAIEETNIFYPFKDIYPKHTYYESDPNDFLINAVFFLQEKRVKDIILNCKETINIKKKIFGHEYNILEILCDCIYYDYEHNKSKIIRIAHLLCSYDITLLTDKCFNMLYHAKRKELSIELEKYSENDKETDKYKCFVCLAGRPEFLMMSNICKCKTHIHIACFESLFKTNKHCTICLEKYKINEGHHDKSYYYPFDDFYFTPLFNHPITKIKETSQIKYALGYAQPTRLQFLFDNISDKEKKEYFESEYYHDAMNGFMFLDNIHTYEQNHKNMKLCRDILLHEFEKYKN